MHELITLVEDKEGHCFYYGDKDHEEWPKHIKKSKLLKTRAGIKVHREWIGEVPLLVNVHQYCDLFFPSVFGDMRRAMKIIGAAMLLLSNLSLGLFSVLYYIGQINQTPSSLSYALYCVTGGIAMNILGNFLWWRKVHDD